MRICRVMPSYPTNLQPGIGLAAYALLQHMREPTLVITKKRTGEPAPTPDHVRLVRIPYWDVVLGNRRGLSRATRLVLKSFGYTIFWLLSLAYMISFRPQITHIHTAMPMLHGLFAKYALRNRLYISFHGTDLPTVKRSLLLRFLVRRANVICVVSDSMSSDLKAIAPRSEILYTPNGVDTTEFPPGPALRNPTVCMVGSLRWQKDYPTALEAFAQFRQRFHEWELAITGDGPDRDFLEKQCVELGIENSVSFQGNQSRHRVSELMGNSRIFMLSSISEGFPKVLLEAASSGTPLVVTDVGSCRTVAEKTLGLIVPPQKPQELAQALAKLASDPTAWVQASAQGIRTADAYSWVGPASILMDSYALVDHA